MTFIENEQRTAKRIALHRPATLIFKDQHYPVHMTDLSEKGCGFLSPVCLNDQEEGQLEISLSTHDEHFTLQLTISVIHCFKTRDSHLVGVIFTHLNAAYRYALKRIVEEG